MRCWAKKLVVVLATGYILFFFSERVFWSFLRPGDRIYEIVLGWLVYSLLAWVFLLLVRQCRVASFSSFFLAGAVFGWLAEGVVVDTLYGNSDKPLPGIHLFHWARLARADQRRDRLVCAGEGLEVGQAVRNRAVFSRCGAGLGPMGWMVASGVRQGQHVPAKVRRPRSDLHHSTVR
jgi:hypothetical protein